MRVLIVCNAPLDEQLRPSLTCKCIVGVQTVLLGDAAHTMTPVMGQGLNCGLEDVSVFASMLEQHGGNVASALPAYSKARAPDVEGILNVNELMTNRHIFVPIHVRFTSLNLAASGYTPLLCYCILHCNGRTRYPAYVYAGLVAAFTSKCQMFSLNGLQCLYVERGLELFYMLLSFVL